MKPSNILDSIKFHVSEKYKGGYELIIKKIIATLDNIQDFANAYFIDLENDTNGHHLQDCYGVDIALEILHTDPNATIIMYSFLPFDKVHDKKPNIDIALRHDNVYWFRTPMSAEDLANIKNCKKTVGTYTMNDEVRKQIGSIMHTFSHIKNWGDPNNYERSEIQKGIAETKKFFPSLKDETDENVIAFIKKVSADRPELMKGLKINGVYCDVEGTVLIDGKPNDKVLQKLSEYAAENKQITLWTDGDVQKLQAKLRKLKVNYPVASKFDFAGAIAEIVIDDQDEYTFTANTKISAEKFIQSSTL